MSSPVESITKTDTGYTVHSQGQPWDVDAIVVASEPGVAADLLEKIAPADSTTKLRACRYSEYAHVQVCYLSQVNLSQL